MIGLLGISYKTASLEIREKFAFSKEEIIPFAEFLQQETDISDIVLLSTCNRTEIYFSQDKYDRQTAFGLLLTTLLKFKKTEIPGWHVFYHYANKEAVRHLFEVTSGLDSMVIGEDQIIGQVKEAYLHCTQAALTDAVLMRLFQKSFEAGKRVRTETGIKLGTTSVSSAAVEKCVALLGDLSDKSVFLIGAGETGNLALQNLVKKGVRKIAVTNRSFERAEQLAARYNGQAIPLEEYYKHLPTFDMVMVATGAPHYLITRDMLESFDDNPEKIAQIYIDLSVPRNIEPSAAEVDGIQLFCVDDLEEVVRTTTEKRLECATKAKEIIDEVVCDFNNWLASRSLRPAIKTITANLQAVNQEELCGYKKIASEEIQQAVDDYARHLTQRYTRMLIKNLKDLTDNGKNIDSVKFINDLFKLD